MENLGVAHVWSKRKSPEQMRSSSKRVQSEKRNQLRIKPGENSIFKGHVQEEKLAKEREKWKEEEGNSCAMGRYQERVHFKKWRTTNRCEHWGQAVCESLNVTWVSDKEVTVDLFKTIFSEVKEQNNSNGSYSRRVGEKEVKSVWATLSRTWLWVRRWQWDKPNPDFTHLAACPWGNRKTKAEVTAKSKGVSNLMLLILRAQWQARPRSFCSWLPDSLASW